MSKVITRVEIGPHPEKCRCWPVFLAKEAADRERYSDDEAALTPEERAERNRIFDELLAEIRSNPYERAPLPTPSSDLRRGLRVQYFGDSLHGGRFGSIVALAKSDGRRIEVFLESTAQHEGMTIWTDNDGKYSSLVVA